jgi:SAM-dependent methyltransferase
MELLIGAGNRREKVCFQPGNEAWTDLVTLDIDPRAWPDVLHDLEILPLPFSDNQFGEVHASEVLEHTGRQGDWRFFFDQFAEFWRILEPGGVLCASCPSWRSVWAWADPGHTRVIAAETLIFLHQPAYADQVGHTAMTDYRDRYRADFDITWSHDDGESLKFVLTAVKPSRYQEVAHGRDQ